MYNRNTATYDTDDHAPNVILRHLCGHTRRLWFDQDHPAAQERRQQVEGSLCRQCQRLRKEPL